MIPADLASRLRNITQDLPASVQPVPVAQKVADALSELSVGQRIMAEIKTLLPNGAYPGRDCTARDHARPAFFSQAWRLAGT